MAASEEHCVTENICPSVSPRVSVLMTIYNAGAYLQESIDSLLEQTFSDWELIAIENGSNDESLSVLKAYADPRINLFSLNENIGRTPALRYAFEQARGEYIAVLDADDISHPERLEREVEFLDKHQEVVLVGTWAQHIDASGKVINTWEPPVDEEELHDCLGWSNPIIHSSSMYRKKAANEVGGYPAEFSYAQDYALILKLAQNGKLSILDEFYCKLRVLHKRMTASSDYNRIAAHEGLTLLQYAAQSLSLSNRARSFNRHVLAISEIKYGLTILKDESVYSGLKMIIQGLYHAPTALWRNDRCCKLFGLKNKFSFNRL